MQRRALPTGVTEPQEPEAVAEFHPGLQSMSERRIGEAVRQVIGRYNARVSEGFDMLPDLPVYLDDAISDIYAYWKGTCAGGNYRVNLKFDGQKIGFTYSGHVWPAGRIRTRSGGGPYVYFTTTERWANEWAVDAVKGFKADAYVGILGGLAPNLAMLSELGRDGSPKVTLCDINAQQHLAGMAMLQIADALFSGSIKAAYNEFYPLFEGEAWSRILAESAKVPRMDIRLQEGEIGGALERTAQGKHLIYLSNVFYFDLDGDRFVEDWTFRDEAVGLLRGIARNGNILDGSRVIFYNNMGYIILEKEQGLLRVAEYDPGEERTATGKGLEGLLRDANGERQMTGAGAPF